ncbi:MAG: hypothetical protein JWN52_7585 [Actinomycetia bacterium]|nr:hypothetical protein [Actinomycetes bacterium]
MTLTPTTSDSRQDFDFLFGSWRIDNRKIADLLDPGCTEWVEFEAYGEARPVLGGLGNIDSFSAAAMPDGGAFEAMTLRLFDPGTGLWRIWWASSRAPGQLDTPVEGRFTDGHGQFFADDVINDRTVKVRFDWTHPTSNTARWEQAFSYDGGNTWKLNWTMAFTRTD